MCGPVTGRATLWLLYGEPAFLKSNGVEEILSQDTVKDILLGEFENITCDAKLEWLFCLTSALQASQQMPAARDLCAEKNAKGGSDFAIQEG
jgi:hypothetical protein